MPIPRVQAHLYSVLVHTGEGYSVRRRQIKFCEFIQSISAVGIIRTGLHCKEVHKSYFSSGYLVLVQF